jgi:hypothetical protein
VNVNVNVGAAPLRPTVTPGALPLMLTVPASVPTDTDRADPEATLAPPGADTVAIAGAAALTTTRSMPTTNGSNGTDLAPRARRR